MDKPCDSLTLVIATLAALAIPASLTRAHCIDDLCEAKWKQLGITPSPICTDWEFLRRVCLDVTGTLPTIEQTRAFLTDEDPAKRARLIDRLLASEDYADFSALRWGDVLRVKSEYPVRIWPKGAAVYHQWIRQSIAANMPYDRFVRELLTSSGSNFRVEPANYFRAVHRKDPLVYAETTALIFLGQRRMCADCHAHPTERWTRQDNLGLAAFFGQVKFKETSEWKEEIVCVDPEQDYLDPGTKQPVTPRFPDGTTPKITSGMDRRLALADWLASPANTDFNRNAVNRIWCWLLGRGIVQEPDDLRPSNPPGNPELLDALARELVAHRYDVLHIYRLILNSKVYQRSSRTNPANRDDGMQFSHYPVRRLDAEPLLDAISQITETHDTYVSLIPEPYTHLRELRSMLVSDGSISSLFLDLFGRPPRNTPFEFERCARANVSQVLRLLNSAEMEGKITASPRISRLVAAGKSDAEIIEEFYLAALCRFPDAQERATLSAYVSAHEKDRDSALRDVLWAILNTKEFLFNH